MNNSTPALNATNLSKLQDNVEDAIDAVQDDVDSLGTNKLDKTNVKTTNTTSDTDTYSCNYINTINNKIYSALSNNTNIDNLKIVGTYGIYNATGTLPFGYSQNDNNIFIEVLMWSNDYGRQILHDVRTTNTYVRNISNNVWQSWKQLNMT